MMIVLLAIFASVWPVYAFDCPIGCKCPVVALKNLTVCQEGNLRAVPRTLNPYTNYLDVSGNAIADLKNRTFVDAGLVNLQGIVLRSTGLRTVHQFTFVGLKWLKELDLSNNSIVTIHQHVFSDNKLLEMVNLSGNPIAKLVTYQFATLQNLRSLDFRNCALKDIEHEAFSSLVSLETLSLKDNPLATLPKDSFTYLKRLRDLDLSGNPWRCDCDIEALAISLLIRGLYRVNGTWTCTYENQTNATLWQNMDHIHSECFVHVETHVKETLMSGSPLYGKSIVFQFMNTTTKRFTRYSSHIFESPLVPWIVSLVAVSTFYVCALSACKLCRRRGNKPKKIKKNYVSDDALEGTSTYHDNFYLIDDDNTASDMSVSVDL